MVKESRWRWNKLQRQVPPRPSAVCGSGQGMETESEIWVESKLVALKICVFSKSFISLGLTFSFINGDVKSIDIQVNEKMHVNTSSGTLKSDQLTLSLCISTFC